MKIHALDIPETREDIALWLEKYLTSPDLSDLAAELAALTEDEESEVLPIQLVLGRELPDVLNLGLSGLSMEKLQRLLSHPDSLLDLQKQILTHESPYWRKLLAQSGEGPAPPLVQPLLDQSGARIRQHRYRVAIASAAIAAALAAAATFVVTRSVFDRAQDEDGGGRDAPFLVSADSVLPPGVETPGSESVADTFEKASKVAREGMAYTKHESVVTLKDPFESLSNAIELMVKANGPYDSAIKMAHLISLLSASCDLMKTPHGSALSPDDQKWLETAAEGWKDELQEIMRAIGLATPSESSPRPLPEAARVELEGRLNKTVAQMVESLRARGSGRGPTLPR